MVTFSVGSIPTNFTICSIACYNGSNKQRILQTDGTSGGDWLHGHWGSAGGGGGPGYAFYGGWITASGVSGVTVVDNWLNMCGKNGSSPPNNILVNTISKGVGSNGGSGSGTLGINTNSTRVNERSDFKLSQVIIWNTILTDAQMLTVANSFKSYLQL
jgi:hypothetical protein